MENRELEQMERAVAAASLELASRRTWDQLAPGVRRELRRPFFRLGRTAILALGSGIWGFWEPGAWLFTAAALLLWLPDDVRDARRRHQRIGADPAQDLLATYALELKTRRLRMTVGLVFGPLLILALGIVAATAANPALPLVLAIYFALKWPLTFFVRLPRTGRELAALGLDEDEDEVDDDEEDDESWPRLLAGLALAYLKVFVLYLGPPVVVFLVVNAMTVPDPRLPAALAVLLAVAWPIVWFTAPDDVEDDA